jgi:heat shock protein HtpX
MNTIKTTLLLSGLTGILLIFGKALGGNAGMTIALMMAAVMNFGAYWFSDKIVLSMYKAEPVDQSHYSGLYQIVEDLALKANLPMPKVYIINDQTPNAFATGRNPANAAVAATTGILSILNKEELTGVMAHELTHVNNRDTLISSIAATIGGAISMLANMAQFALIFGSRDNENNSSTAGTFLMMILAPIAATLIQFAVSRSREYAADAGAANITGNPLALASALDKLENFSHYQVMPTAEQNPATAHMFIINPLKGDSIRSLFSTHPATQERIRRLREMV